MGKKTWEPGKSLPKFITATFGLALREQNDIVERIAEAIVEVGPAVRRAMVEHAGFVDIGKRMLTAWQEGLAGLRDKRTYAIGGTPLGEAFSGFSDPAPVKTERKIVGRSELLGRRRRSPGVR